MIFQLGEQKWNHFLFFLGGGGQKLVKKQSRQSNSKYNFLQYAFFSKKVYKVKRIQGMSYPGLCVLLFFFYISWEVFENFSVKSNFTIRKVTFNCKSQKNGAQDVLLAYALISFVPPAVPTPMPSYPDKLTSVYV